MLCMLSNSQVHRAPHRSIFTVVELSFTEAGAGRCHPVHLIFPSTLPVCREGTAVQITGVMDTRAVILKGV